MSLEYCQQNTFTCESNESTLPPRESTLCDAHTSTERDAQSALYQNNAHALLLSILNSDWLQHERTVCGVYEEYTYMAQVYLIERLFCFVF